MKTIYEQNELVKQLLDKQPVENGKKYKKFHYIDECPVEGGLLVLNTATYEFLFLDNDELSVFNNIEINNYLGKYLVEHYFFVPEDFDDKKFTLSLTDTRLQIQSIYKEVPLSHFVILTTTGCNARCFYCFEKGAKVSNMTEQTAHDVADFIEKKGDKKVRIQWFGGEPLVNTRAIDIICQDLLNKNIEFESKMVSNAYLLDEGNIKKAIELWNLKTIQITLDGTEEVYNRVKDYVYKTEISPFVKVLNNIENALKAGINVSIRLNMDEHNSKDLFELSKQLVERFNSYKNCYIYVVRLFEDTCSKIKNRSVTERHKIIKDSIELNNYIYNNMPKQNIEKLPKSFGNPNNCMACSDNSVMIVPDGHLGKCEHFVDSDFYGSIYSDEKDIAKIQRYKERTTVVPECDSCPLRPLCVHLKVCTGAPHHCDELDKEATVQRLHSKMQNIYSKYLENQE